MKWLIAGFLITLLTIDSRGLGNRLTAIYKRIKRKREGMEDKNVLTFDGYETIGEIVQWVESAPGPAEQFERLRKAQAESAGFANFHKYITTKGSHLAGYSGLIVRNPPKSRWGSTPSMEFWERIYSESGFAVATANKRSQLARQLDDTWADDVSLIQDVIDGVYQVPQSLKPLFTSRAL